MWILGLFGLVCLFILARVFFEIHWEQTGINMRQLVKLENEGKITNREVDDALFVGRFPIDMGER